MAIFWVADAIFTAFLYLVIGFWIVRTAKSALFYLYLWQLKEYHIGRFLDHFRTAQGKNLLINKLFVVKVFLFLFFLFPMWAATADFQLAYFGVVFFILSVVVPLFTLTVLYGLEAVRFRSSRKPVFTEKTILLFVLILFGEFLAILLVHRLSAFVVTFHWGFVASTFVYPIGLLVVDLLMPLFVSAVVLALQPFAVLARNRIIRQAREKRKKFKNLKVVGITGSYGKTSTKEFLAYILGQKFQVLKTPEHMNSEMGIAQTILRSLTDEHDIFVCEMGAYNKGGIKLLADIVKPDIGIVTGVNEQHLATFGSMENLLSAEGGGELAEALPKEGVLFVNQNAISRLADKIHYNAKCKVLTPQIPQAKVAKDLISFEVEGVSFRVPVYGGHNAQNLLLAIAAARELGMRLEEIAKASESMPLELSAMKVKKVQSGATVIDSTYSANPDGVIADLEYLNLYEGKKVLVMPCLIELGPAAKEAHKRIGQKIAEVCDLAIITTKEHFEDIKEGMYEVEPRTCEVMYMENTQEILGKIGEANAILLEGGKESRLQLQLIALLLNND